MTEQFRQEILNTVTDPARAEKAAKLADQLRQLFADAERQYNKDFETFRSLNANYDTKETAFQGFFMNMNNQAQAVTAGAKQYIKELESRGVDVVPVPFDDVYHFTGSGMHCATFSYWREDG